MTATTTRFDPATHLTKQGWKGKGTALKHGHATRPLPVVQKKTLSGIGKDRDEAVPFWDHIFASTAASLFSPTSSSTPKASPTSTRPTSPESQARTRLSASAKMGREVARKGLYSRFFKGTNTSRLADEELEAGEVTVEVVAGPSRVMTRVEEEADGGGIGETKEEKRARRAERARRKAAKAEAALMLLDPGQGEVPQRGFDERDGDSTRKKKRKREGGPGDSAHTGAKLEKRERGGEMVPTYELMKRVKKRAKRIKDNSGS